MKERTIYVCGHTGSDNRGCEALVRSTYKVLKECGASDLKFFTFNEAADKALGVDKEVKDLVPYQTRDFFHKILFRLERKGVFEGKTGRDYIYNLMLKDACDNDVAINIGGDTYCYGKPEFSYSLNDVCKKKKIPTIFWGCSVEERLLNDKEMQEDINKYSYVIARESVSYDILSRIIDDKNKLYLTCDPAFLLDAETVALPENFLDKNTVGINVSPMVLKNVNDPNDLTYINVRNLIKEVLSRSDMNVCLIPHVYRQSGDRQDLDALEKIYDSIEEKNRVAFVKEGLSCKQLKYIISRCRFFVGARTHSMIAAYSTGVPALALGYSVKAKGIAKDVLGSVDDYVVSWNDIKGENDVTEKFFDCVVKREEALCKRYNDFLPEYKTTILKAVWEVLGKIK